MEFIFFSLLILGSATASKNHLIAADLTFVPEVITIKINDTVEWVNSNPANVAHGIQLDYYKSPMIRKGQSWIYKFINTGTYKYKCFLHTNMTGTIIVEN